MTHRRFPLTFGLVAAVMLASQLAIKAQAPARQPANASNPSTQTTKQDDGPVAITERTNNAKPAAEERKPLKNNQFGNMGTPLLNNKGDVAFQARYVSDKVADGYGSGLFVRKADGTWSYVRDGDKGLNFQSAILGVNHTFINDNGDLTFTAVLNVNAPDFKVSGSEEVVSRGVKQSGIFTKTAEGLKSVYLMGQEIPNNPATYIGFAAASMNTKGVMSFIGTYADPDGRGLFILENGQLKLVARSGQKTPAGEDTQYSEHFYPSPINERGEVAFFCRISGGGAIFVRRQKGIEAIAIQDQPSPIPGSNYIGFGNRIPAINDKGEVVFAGFVDGEKAGRVLFFKGEGPTQVVARSGDTVPEMKATFTDFMMPSLNAKGDIAFIATYAGRSRGIFVKTAKGIESVALYEQSVPGLDRKDDRNVFNNFLNPVINDNGDIAFLAQIRSSQIGIFYKKKGEELKMIALTGEPAPIK